MLGVTGGIAAYKAAALTSKLTQAGAQVYVIMTEGAQKFVTPLTFQSLSHLPVYVDTFTEPDPNVIAHIDLADRADLIVVAPATANIIGKLAHGIADDMLTTTLLASKAPVMIAPAMNVNMYNHPAVQANMKRLEEYGYQLIQPAEGLLACGWTGKGRLAEPEEIVQIIERFFCAASSVLPESQRDLAGQYVVVTAGPTREKIDPVRYISNHSSGKMGYAIAEAARDRGAEVVLISGPTSLPKPEGVHFVGVESVADMYTAVMRHFPKADIVIKSAAVSDYRPKVTHDHKLKKTQDDFVLELEKAPDILAELGRHKTTQFVVGFAAETQDLLAHASDKLKRKNADLIVANNVLQEGAGMGSDTNIVTILSRDGERVELPQLDKRQVADRLFDVIKAKLAQRSQAQPEKTSHNPSTG